MEFKRALNTGDEYDYEIVPGSANSILWAYGQSDSDFGIHYDRGMADIVF
jgi:hypothetical protein